MKNMATKDFDQCAAAHIYSRTENGYLLFYSLADYLVFFSIACVNARKRDIHLLGICPMKDHLHYLAAASHRSQIYSYIRDTESMYALAFNQELGTSGRIFHKSFGCSIKRGAKSVRNACSYLYNNPGEKGLCARAEQYRWTFLAYARCDNPFSERIKKETASKKLRMSMRLIDSCSKLNNHLTYNMIRRLFKGLSEKESEQLTDYIIVSYNAIDYTALLSYYNNSYEQACLAFASNQGSEYGLREDYVPGSHLPYLQIPPALKKYHGIEDVKEALRLPEVERAQLLCDLMLETHANMVQLKKYLRLPRD